MPGERRARVVTIFLGPNLTIPTILTFVDQTKKSQNIGVAQKIKIF